jgi:hypothetical protein
MAPFEKPAFGVGWRLVRDEAVAAAAGGAAGESPEAAQRHVSLRLGRCATECSCYDRYERALHPNLHPNLSLLG